MYTKQTIAIIGAANNMCSTIAAAIAKDNYRLLLCADAPGNAVTLANAIKAQTTTADIELMDCPAQACWEADIIIMAAEADTEKIKAFASQKIIINMTGTLNEKHNRQIQSSLPNSKVVNAFDAGETLTVPGKYAATYITGDDEEALQTVAALIKTAGLQPAIMH